ncbi:hypothetical protein Aeqsu_2812 [Aequorivita sublithincola DSM 14238]|uniref:Uncharacterized protein n=1 Tax=Aequorivita sublithincola (strain DSM 14238 / LMG 21431 / ACAM 643 / 9-3) TaxID=746697 RepID=I3YZ44_AEQSU|nr:hypothetical protein Aeqsu_2812 [Aequorivita sublithincola DSM 14238]
MTTYYKTIKIISIFIICYLLISASVFTYLNFEYILKPELNPQYENTRSAFGYNEGLAKFKYFGLQLPIYILAFWCPFLLLNTIFVSIFSKWYSKKQLIFSFFNWVFSFLLLYLYFMAQLSLFWD